MLPALLVHSIAGVMLLEGNLTGYIFVLRYMIDLPSQLSPRYLGPLFRRRKHVPLPLSGIWVDGRGGTGLRTHIPLAHSIPRHALDIPVRCRARDTDYGRAPGTRR